MTPEARALRGDPAKLHDVLRNLVENAVNYTPEDGARSRCTRASRTGGFELARRDDGPGHPDEDLVARVRALLPRGQVARASPAAPASGLAIVKHLVELHGRHA